MAAPAEGVGSIGWVDLTVPNAEALRDFYQAVIGWGFETVEMPGYQDFCMTDPLSKKAVAGICHSQGANAALPPTWLIYVTVANVEESAARCVAMGGQIVAGPTGESGSRFYVIRDPAGAAMALFQTGG